MRMASPHRTLASLPLACAVLLLCCCAWPCAGAVQKTVLVGVGKVDITPTYPIRLSGYAARKTESEGVAQRIYAKALAFGSDRQKPALLLTVDNTGVPGTVRDKVVARLKSHSGVDPDRVAICSTHTHSAPLLSGYLSNLFCPPLSREEQSRVDRYTRELVDALERVSVEALKDRRPALLFHTQGSAAFAANRRTPGGPVDHDVPVLVARTPAGTTRAMLIGYACHCTTLTGEFNQVCGDWAGYAAEHLEQEIPGAVALVSIGCAGDANPSPRPGFELAKQHGKALAAGVRDAVSRTLRPVTGKLNCRTRAIELPYGPLPTRAEWESRASQTNHIGQQARMNLARLERGETLPRYLPYMVQTWAFGKTLALVLLPGEVVVDYSLRLKRELDASRLWVTAYANDVPCYIPSERILKEGGYEGGGAMVYYDRPAPFAPGVEERIVKTVHALVPAAFKVEARRSAP